MLNDAAGFKRILQTAHFWKIFFHGHQSCQNISENKKTVVNGLLKVKVHGLERLPSFSGYYIKYYPVYHITFLLIN